MQEDSRYQQTGQLCLENDDIYSHISENEPLDLNCLLSKLQDQIPNSQWYQFGLALGVPKQILSQLEHQTEESRLSELLDYWLKNHQGRATWQEVAAAERRIELYQQTDHIDNEEYSEWTYTHIALSDSVGNL